MKKIIIYGASGFVGSVLIPRLEREGYFIIACDIVEPSFEYKGEFINVDILKDIAGQLSEEHEAYISNPYAVINLAGKSIFGKFTPEHKDAIYQTRILGTQKIASLMQEHRFRPRVMVQASAVGFYGNKNNIEITENSKQGETFLSEVVHDWEHAARRTPEETRLVIFRQGHILGSKGLLGVLKPMYRKGLGGPLGNGEFYYPWIHTEDLVEYYLEALSSGKIQGVYNVIAGEPILQKTFSKALARAMHKPHFLRIPQWALRLVYGEFADEMMISQKIVAQRINAFEYKAVFQDIDEALGYECGE